MAIYRSDNVTVHRPSVTADDSDTVSVRGEFVLPAALVAGDVVELVKLPAGTKIVDAMLDTTAAVGAGTVTDAANAVTLIAANAVTALGAGVDRLDTAAAVQAAPLPTESVVVFTAGAGGGLAGDVIGLTVQYRNQRYGN
jgi:hypothetical protein